MYQIQGSCFCDSITRKMSGPDRFIVVDMHLLPCWTYLMRLSLRAFPRDRVLTPLFFLEQSQTRVESSAQPIVLRFRGNS